MDASDLAAWLATYGQVDLTPFVTAEDRGFQQGSTGSEALVANSLDKVDLMDAAIDWGMAFDVPEEESPLAWAAESITQPLAATRKISQTVSISRESVAVVSPNSSSEESEPQPSGSVMNFWRECSVEERVGGR